MLFGNAVGMSNDSQYRFSGIVVLEALSSDRRLTCRRSAKASYDRRVKRQVILGTRRKPVRRGPV